MDHHSLGRIFWTGLILMFVSGSWISISLRRAGLISGLMIRWRLQHFFVYAGLCSEEGRPPLGLWLFLCGALLYLGSFVVLVF